MSEREVRKIVQGLSDRVTYAELLDALAYCKDLHFLRRNEDFYRKVLFQTPRLVIAVSPCVSGR